MAKIMKKPSEGLNTSSFHATPTTAFTCDDADPLPAMFTTTRSAGSATKARRAHGKARIPPYVVVLVLLAFVPTQTILLKLSFYIDREQAIEDALVLAKKGVAQAVTLISIPAAEAAVTVRSKTLAGERVPSFDNGQWSEAVDTFKRLVAERKAPHASAVRTENDRLIHN